MKVYLGLNALTKMNSPHLKERSALELANQAEWTRTKSTFYSKKGEGQKSSHLPAPSIKKVNI